MIAFPRTKISHLDVRASDGWILVSGSTNSYGLATADAILTACYCAFRASVGWLGLLDSAGTPRYVTYLSGQQRVIRNYASGNEQLRLASFDTGGNIQAAGITRAPGFPTTVDAYQRFIDGCPDYCAPSADVSYFTLIDGVTGKLRASTLYGGKTASVQGVVTDPSGDMWMLGDRQPFMVLMRSDATSLVGSWPAPRTFISTVAPTPIPGGFANVTDLGQIRRYQWQYQGPRIYALSGQIAPGETVDVYTAGYNGDQAWLYFDGILASAEQVQGEPGHWKATVPGGITRNGIIDIALIAEEQRSVTKVSTN